MSKLYERCPACSREGFWKSFSVTDRGSHQIATLEGCPACNSLGFVPTGLTTAQVERLVAAERARLGDPGAGPVVTLRFRSEQAKEDFLTGLMAECVDDSEHVGVVWIGPANGGTILDAEMIDVEMEERADA